MAIQPVARQVFLPAVNFSDWYGRKQLCRRFSLRLAERPFARHRLHGLACPANLRTGLFQAECYAS